MGDVKVDPKICREAYPDGFKVESMLVHTDGKASKGLIVGNLKQGDDLHSFTFRLDEELVTYCLNDCSISQLKVENVPASVHALYRGITNLVSPNYIKMCELARITNELNRAKSNRTFAEVVKGVQKYSNVSRDYRLISAVYPHIASFRSGGESFPSGVIVRMVKSISKPESSGSDDALFIRGAFMTLANKYKGRFE